MNFLAHAYLSGSDPDVLFGNFVADGIKGSAVSTFPENVQKGIRLHREIDRYTDSHPIFKNSVKQLQPTFRKYSVVIVDIYYDHFLAKNWEQYSKTDLKSFAATVYRILMKRYRLLPQRTKRALPYMIAQNWLVGYANLSDLHRIFSGMSRRARFDSGMENSVEYLKAHYEIFEKDFFSFFPAIISHCSESTNKL
jgi:acyl carrier protein phosphodiesterase